MKSKLKYYLRMGVFCFATPFLLWNCEGENIDSPEGQQSNIETVAVNEAVDFFNVKMAADPAKPGSETYVTPHLDHIAQEEISNSDALLTIIPATTIYEEHYSRILLLKIDDEIQSLVFSMYPSDGSTHEHFSGEIIITDINGNFLNGYRVRNGEFVSQLRKTATAGKTAVAAKNNNVVCPDHGECTEDSTCVLCLQELEEVVVTGNSGNNGGPTPFVDLNDFPGIDEGGGGGLDMGMGWDYGPGDGSSNDDDDESSCPDGYTKDNNDICVEDDKIIDELTGKEKCVHDLLNETGNSYIKDILSKFEGDSEFDIKIESKDNVYKDGKEVAAGTSKPLNGMITIQISTSSASDRSVLSVAKTILHEYIHADMFRKLNTKYLSTDDLDFKKTYEEFENQKFEASAQHETMAALYVDEMTKALKNFHENALVGDYNYLTDNGTNPLPDSFYEALAWLGLKEHDVQAYIDLPDGKKQELEEAISLFYHGITKNCPEN